MGKRVPGSREDSMCDDAEMGEALVCMGNGRPERLEHVDQVSAVGAGS